MHHVNFDVDTPWWHVCIKISKTPYKYVSINMLYKLIFYIDKKNLQKLQLINYIQYH
jgi:hypothetical protein